MNNSTTIEKVKSLTNNGLFALLKHNGKQVGPVVSTTRSVYEKRIFNFFKTNKVAENDFIRNFESYEYGQINQLPSMRIINDEKNHDEEEDEEELDEEDDEEEDHIVTRTVNIPSAPTKILKTNKVVDLNNNVIEDNFYPKRSQKNTSDLNFSVSQPKPILIKRNVNVNCPKQSRLNCENPTDYNCIPKSNFFQQPPRSFANQINTPPEQTLYERPQDKNWIASNYLSETYYNNLHDNHVRQPALFVSSAKNNRFCNDYSPQLISNGYKQTVFDNFNQPYPPEPRGNYNHAPYKHHETGSIYSQKTLASPFNKTSKDNCKKETDSLFKISHCDKNSITGFIGITLILIAIVFICYNM